MLYESFYGLEREPFSLPPDPAFLYLTPDCAEAFAQLIYTVESRKGFAVLSGEVGTGKTMLLRALLESVGPDVRTAYLINPPRTRAELYAGLAAEFDLRLEGPETWALALQRYLIDAHEAGAIVVALLDEAQALSPEVLDEIRLLTNLETASVKLLQVILAGQPELDVMIESHALRALRQRIVMRHQLKPLGSWETVEYIARRMRVAGADLLPFDGQACVAIYRYSRGIPRLINLLCDNSLVAGYAASQPLIDAAIVESAARDAHLSAPAGHDEGRSRLERAASGSRRRGYWGAALTLAVVAAVSSAVLFKSYPERVRTLIYHVESLIGADSGADNPLPPRLGRGGHSRIDRLTRAVIER
jgi:general secretion pathway protein A